VTGDEMGLERESRAELTQIFTLDRARFLNKRGKLTSDKFDEILTKFKNFF
jgi:mRNA-degrading endonuclease toxin of MazEF toxin-antitoxin module